MERQPHEYTPDWPTINRALTQLTNEICLSPVDSPELYAEYDEWLAKRQQYLRNLYGTRDR
jgi:hypothetical protein